MFFLAETYEFPIKLYLNNFRPQAYYQKEDIQFKMVDNYYSFT